MRYDVFDCHVTEAYIAHLPLSTPKLDVVEQEQVKSTERDRLKAKLAPGERADVQGLSLSLAQHDPDAERVLVAVQDPAQANGVEMLDLHEDRPVRFVRGDDLVTVTYTRASRTHDVRRTRAHIVAVVDDAGTDPCVERAIRLADRIRSARASHR